MVEVHLHAGTSWLHNITTFAMFETIKNWLGYSSKRISDVAGLPGDSFPMAVLQESFASADLSLRIEDQGWVRLGAQLAFGTDTAPGMEIFSIRPGNGPHFMRAI
jgi:hypothetical protein